MPEARKLCSLSLAYSSGIPGSSKDEDTYFGREQNIDNLRAAVSRADWFDPELNPKVEEFCRHYGTVILPTKPAMPRHKGKVESAVKYAQDNALKGRKFAGLTAQNLFLLDWETNVADTRIHGTTRQQVGKLFKEVEKLRLLPLPISLFPVFEEAPRTVHRDGYIELQRAYYSVPPEYVGRQVWARWEARLVRIYNQLGRENRTSRTETGTALDGKPSRKTEMVPSVDDVWVLQEAVIPYGQKTGVKNAPRAVN